MLSQKELIDKAEALLMRATYDTEDENVSAAHVANELAAARLFFDMAHSGLIFPINAYADLEDCDLERLRPGGIIRVHRGDNG